MGDVVAITKPQTFEDFWKECPKKVGKLLAKVKWDAITSSAGLDAKTKEDTGDIVKLGVLRASSEELIKGMRAYRRRHMNESSGWVDPYALHPSTWLNQGRWMDQ